MLNILLSNIIAVILLLVMTFVYLTKNKTEKVILFLIVIFIFGTIIAWWQLFVIAYRSNML